MALPVSDLILHPPQPEELSLMRAWAGSDRHRLLLGGGLSERQRLLLTQVEWKQHARRKLPAFAANPELIIPSRLALEQASSEATARFKAGLFSGDRLLDAGCGMGIDALHIGAHFRSGILLERDAELGACTAQNLRTLGLTHLSVMAGHELASAWPELPGPFDLIYLDPARRDAGGGKVFKLKDTEPDLTAWLPRLLERTPCVAVKTSPLLDIRQACRELPGIRAVYVLATEQECREVLLLIGREPVADPVVHAVDTDTGRSLSATLSAEQDAEATFGDPEAWLFEPGPEVLKAGLFRTAALSYGLRKLHPHSHLYTGPADRPDFQGRRFRIRQVLKPERAALQQALPEGKAHLCTRNFPETVAVLRRQWRLHEGGDDYLFATTLAGGQRVVLHGEKPEGESTQPGAAE